MNRVWPEFDWQGEFADFVAEHARCLRVLLRSHVERGSWYPFRALHPGASRNGREFRRAVTRTTTLVRSHYPAPMAIKMLLKPLTVPPALTRLNHGGRSSWRNA